MSVISKVIFPKFNVDNFGNIDFIGLRYFNVAGSDKEYEIGEAQKPANHIIPISYYKIYLHI